MSIYTNTMAKTWSNLACDAIASVDLSDYNSTRSSIIKLPETLDACFAMLKDDSRKRDSETMGTAIAIAEQAEALGLSIESLARAKFTCYQIMGQGKMEGQRFTNMSLNAEALVRKAPLLLESAYGLHDDACSAVRDAAVAMWRRQFERANEKSSAVSGINWEECVSPAYHIDAYAPGSIDMGFIAPAGLEGPYGTENWEVVNGMHTDLVFGKFEKAIEKYGTATGADMAESTKAVLDWAAAQRIDTSSYAGAE